MTLDEIKAQPVGTEFLVRMKIVDNETDDDGELKFESGDVSTHFVRPVNIESIAPPKPLAVGDKVNPPWGDVAEICGIHAGRAWCLDEEGYRTIFLRELTRT